MKQQNIFTNTLAFTGTVLVLFPILTPLMLSVIVMASKRILRFDYLMPVELFPFALTGGVLLLWASLRACSYQRLIGWSLGLAAGLLIVSQGLAIFTGLASGEAEPSGGWWGLILALLVIYSVALVALGVGGVLLLRDLFRIRGRK